MERRVEVVVEKGTRWRMVMASLVGKRGRGGDGRRGEGGIQQTCRNKFMIDVIHLNW